MRRNKSFLQIFKIYLTSGVIFWMGFNFQVSSLPIPSADPADYPPAEERMFLPPNFPYDAPYGYRSSGLLCLFSDLPYFGGWPGRACAGPVPPFAIPTPPTTTTTPKPTQQPQQHHSQPTSHYKPHHHKPHHIKPKPHSPHPPRAPKYKPNNAMATSGSSLSLSYSNYGGNGVNPSYLTYPVPPPAPSHLHDFVHNPNLYADYGDPIEGNPWEPDEDEIFIEYYGVSASKPGFRLGDPNNFD